MRPFAATRTRVLVGAVVAALSLIALSGCGRPTDSAGSDGNTITVEDTPAKGTVEIWAHGADGAALPAMFKEFQKNNPDVEFKLTEVPEAEFINKMTAAITAGTVPDLIYAFTETQAPLIATGGFDSTPAGLVEEADFLPAIWENSVVDGQQYGIPWYTYAQITNYRKDLTDGLITEAPTDWASLRESGEKLKADGVEYPIALYVAWDEYTARQLSVFAAQNGGSFISDDNSEWTINTPENVEAVEYWTGLIKDGLASPDGPAFQDIVSWLSQGKNAVLVDGGPWFTGMLDEANGEGWAAKNLAYEPLLAGPDGATAAMSGGGSWMVPTDGENKDAAWKFARFMAEPESQVMWYKTFGNLPAVEASWDDPALKGNPVLTAVREALQVGVTPPNVPTWTQVGEAIGEEVERVVRGDATVEEALEAAQQQADSIGMGSE